MGLGSDSPGGAESDIGGRESNSRGRSADTGSDARSSQTADLAAAEASIGRTDNEAGDWERELADQGYSQIAGETAEDATPGKMAEMSDILGRSAEATSGNLVETFGIFGLIEAVDRYGLATATIGTLKAYAPELVAGLFEEITATILAKLTLSIAFKVAVYSNPNVAIAVAIMGIIAAFKLAGVIGAGVHDSVLSGGSVADAIESSQLGAATGEGGELQRLARKLNLDDVLITTVAPFIKSVDIVIMQNRRRSNIIGSGATGYTLEENFISKNIIGSRA